ncbi:MULTISPECIES: HK97-gp10 family putative phage morphogenesis protein [unclassified Bradyrhizobium]|uniref:HK97-gp10 family putative phage morphogenesis protein n=1 Tax=unclassified Bradyrhizobium TaxID=2631580 RepID=UPI00291669C1|nr:MULTISPECIES: HK97-gp10 family putative phage morphogenesis protein [unclassified Bradyrhizobium]
MADDLEAHLNALPEQLRERLSDVLREQAFRLSDAQRAALQSLEQDPETGALEASCTVAPGANELEYLVQAGGDMTTKEVREGSGVSYDYAEAFEFGTSRQPARPWFYPTYNAMKDDIREAINDALNEVLK